MRSMKICNECGYRHARGRCCIDIYQQLGQTKGPSVVGKVILAFLLPLLVFIGSLMLAGYILSGYMGEGGGKTILSFSAALLVTVIFVQFIRIFTRKPINMKNDSNKKI